MEAFDPRAVRNEMRLIASLEVANRDIHMRIRKVEEILQDVHAKELDDALMVLSVYKMYRDLFFSECVKNIPDDSSRTTYVIAMRFFARTYLRLLT